MFKVSSYYVKINMLFEKLIPSPFDVAHGMHVTFFIIGRCFIKSFDQLIYVTLYVADR